ncbi:MAG: hypothetical protein ACPHP9_13765 [bacterium]
MVADPPRNYDCAPAVAPGAGLFYLRIGHHLTKKARRLLSWGRHKCPWAIGPVIKVLERLEKSRWLGGRRKPQSLADEKPK